jgi:hypothetical protein
MKKLQTVGLALVVVCAFGAILATSAFATEWLSKGAAIAAALPADTLGILVLTDTVIDEQAECSVLFEGTVGPGAAGTITKALDLMGNENALDCFVTALHGAACAQGELATITLLNLPWNTLVVLVTGPPEEFRDEITTSSIEKSLQPGYEILCKNTVETCTSDTSVKLVNLMEGVESAFDAKSELSECTAGGKKAGEITGKGTTTLNEMAANPLTVS